MEGLPKISPGREDIVKTLPPYVGAQCGPDSSSFTTIGSRLTKGMAHGQPACADQDVLLHTTMGLGDPLRHLGLAHRSHEKSGEREVCKSGAGSFGRNMKLDPARSGRSRRIRVQ